MSLASKVAVSTIYQTIGKVAAVGLGLIQVFLLTRFLGESGFGQYSTVNAFFAMVMIFAELGLHITNVTNMSAPDADKTKILSNAMTLRVFTSITAVLLGIIVGLFLLPFEQTVKTGILVSALAFTFLSTNQIFVGVFQKYFASHIIVLGEVLSKVIVIAGILILSKLGFGVVAILASFNIAFGIYLALTMVTAYKYVPFALAFDFPYWKKLLVQSWPIAFSGILNLVYFRADTVILSLFKGSAAAGIYSVPYRVLEVTIAFPALFMGLLLPILSDAAARTDMERFKMVMQKGLEVLLHAAFLVVALGLIFAEPIVLLVAGENFRESIPIFRVLVFAVVILFMGTLFGHAIPALQLQKKMIWGFATAAVVGISSYLILIPKYSYYGAAAGTILTELIASGFAIFLVMRHTKQRIDFIPIIKSALSICAVIGTGIFVSENVNFVPWYIQAVFVSVLYVGLLYTTRAITREELTLIIPKRSASESAE
jgi:O-antigen/teichoic acid export membrane protein